jgi:hypothetical protein
VIGWESMIVLEDIRALSPAEAEEVCVWVARTLLAAATYPPHHPVRMMLWRAANPIVASCHHEGRERRPFSTRCCRSPC